MTDCKRFGKKWTTPEVLNLQREYELLKLSVEEIAIRHKRSVKSILLKLDAEGFTDCLGFSNENNIPSFTTIAENVNKAKAKAVKTLEKELDDVLSDTDSSSDYDDDVSDYDDDVSEYNSDDDELCVDCNINTLSDRVWSLETSVVEINTMVKQMFDQMTSQRKTKKLSPLRK